MALVELAVAHTRYLPVLAAQDIRRDRERGLDRTAGRHAPAWEALQAACEWEEETGGGEAPAPGV